jgi:hypothetical protein
VLKAIADRKYAQSSDGRDVLRATKQAKLVHILPRSKHVEHFVHLEEIREEL